MLIKTSVQGWLESHVCYELRSKGLSLFLREVANDRKKTRMSQLYLPSDRAHVPGTMTCSTCSSIFLTISFICHVIPAVQDRKAT